MTQKKKFNLDFWLWLGGAILVLIFIISFLVIPYSSDQTTAPSSAETTKPTTKPEATEPETTKSGTTKTPEPTPTQAPTPTPEPTPTPAPTPTPSQPYTTPSTTSTCHHEEGGRCWDDLEDEAYSAGAYDRQYGYYGATLEYAEDCDALCREIIEDAYDEGWYDY